MAVGFRRSMHRRFRLRYSEEYCQFKGFIYRKKLCCNHAAQ
ncbi:hypothetical protein HMPREF0454_00448 [Hafnia alvei ATCC 51873]|uniref:Uncharacterized protein n=1 Tax=Hafnia alvei ATCC 51873 TaxID=1002364 RepID=G9Y1N1_HAFAL|nr:hypothetical protein HMPREF0454_00448 [Hafnia alvei ATCC 51873]